MWIASEIQANGLPRGIEERTGLSPPFVLTSSSRSQAIHLLQTLAQDLGLNLVQSRLRCLGRGSNHDAYLGWFERPDTGEQLSVVARIPKLGPTSAAPDRDDFLRRLGFLDALGKLDLEVQVPRTYGALETRRGWATVQTGLDGIQLDLIRDVAPLDAIARAAAICHQLDPKLFASYLPSCSSRRQFALQELEIIEATQIPGRSRALQWAHGHLPPEIPCSVIHGDLLPQNLLLDLELKLGGILDWDFAAFGDPAYDLAVTTGGVTRPFGVENGLRRLLEAYNGLAQKPLHLPDVQLYELCIRAHEYAEAIRHRGRKSNHADTVAQAFRSLLKRIGAL